MLGDYEAKLITGTRIDNGEEWSKKFFSNNQKLMDEFEEFGVGEIVNVRLTKGKGPKQWNVAGFEVPSQELIDEVKERANPTKSSGDGGPKKEYKNMKSTWNGRTGEAYDRSAAVYLAWDIIKETFTPAALKKLSADNLDAVLFGMANKINDYIHNGKDGSDPLAPPEID
jgi:hypothetical protein